MSVGTRVATGYERFMENLIRRFGIACIALVVAVSIFLSPANAVAMFDCNDQQSVETAHDHGHAHNGEASSAELDTASPTHLTDHCVGHACVVAVEAPSARQVNLRLMLSAGFPVQSQALAAAEMPEGLRRPPRV